MSKRGQPDEDQQGPSSTHKRQRRETECHHLAQQENMDPNCAASCSYLRAAAGAAAPPCHYRPTPLLPPPGAAFTAAPTMAQASQPGRQQAPYCGADGGGGGDGGDAGGAETEDAAAPAHERYAQINTLLRQLHFDRLGRQQQHGAELGHPDPAAAGHGM